jgi:methyl-accepting chemotaxis protein
VSLGVAKPIRALVKLLQRLAAGEEVEITGTERKDEVGETARAVTDIKLFLAKKAREEAEAKALQDLRAVERRKIEMKRSHRIRISGACVCGNGLFLSQWC